MQMTCKRLKESDKNNELVVSEQTEWARATAWASSPLRAEKVVLAFRKDLGWGHSDEILYKNILGEKGKVCLQ